jgi:PAS domain S-box-containing protein
MAKRKIENDQIPYLETKKIINDLQKRINELEKQNKELLKAKIKAEESEELFDQFLKKSPIYLFVKDENLRIVKLSNNFEKMFGIPSGLLIGKTMEEVFPSEFAKNVISDDKKALKGKKLIEIEEEFNGRKYFTQKFPIYKKGKPYYLAGYTTEITERKYIEEALIESRERYRELIELAVDGILIGSNDGTILEANSYMCSLLGRKEKDLIGLHISEILFTNESLNKKPFQFDDLRKGKVVINEREIMRPDGSVITIEMRTKMMPNGTFQSIYRDISERKLAEETLRKSEENYRLIFEHSPLGILHFDNNGVILACNNNFVKIIGSSHKILIGLNMLDLPDGKLVAAVNESLKGAPGLYEDNYHSLTADKVTPVRAVFASVHDEFGNISGGVGIIEDSTERILSESRLRKSESLNKALVDHLPQRIFLKDTASVYLSCNENFAKDNRLTQETIVGKNDFDLFSAELANAYRNDDQDVIKSGRMKVIEEKYSLNGLERWAHTVKVPYKDGENNIIGVLGVFEDITEKKKAEQQLIQLSADKDRFISILSHDLKSPFNSLIVLAKLLKKNIRNYDVEKIESFLNEFSKSAQNTYDLMEDLLDWARSQSGKLPFKPQKLNLRDVFSDIIDVSKQNPNAASISFNNFTKSDLSVLADIDMLKTILRNLVSNAIKSIGEEGQIRIFAEQKNSEILISVSDNGIGIPSSRIDNLFDASHVRSISGGKAGTGSGFGLFLCKDFVEKHNGRIWVQSEQGKGSVFCFTIPIN